MRQNISPNVSKNVFWEFIIKVGCTSDVIFFWDIYICCGNDTDDNKSIVALYAIREVPG